MDAKTACRHIQENRLPDPRLYKGMVSLLVADYLHNKIGNPELDRHILEETVHRLNRSLDGYLGSIGVLAAVAPLLGLLGTVLGMIVTFEVISVFGTGNAKAMSESISEALITTQTGLLVAIPGMYMHGFLQRRAQNLKQRNTGIGYYLRRHL
jgi:biopolymer transport protein ExbB